MLPTTFNRRHTSYYPITRTTPITRNSSLDNFPSNKLVNNHSNMFVNETPRKENIERKYILVVQEPDNDKYMKDTLEDLGIKVIDKTYVEKYLIFSIRTSEKVISEIKKYSWFVNVSRGRS